jgi:hypothetical protein
MLEAMVSVPVPDNIVTIRHPGINVLILRTNHPYDCECTRCPFSVTHCDIVLATTAPTVMRPGRHCLPRTKLKCKIPCPSDTVWDFDQRVHPLPMFASGYICSRRLVELNV